MSTVQCDDRSLPLVPLAPPQVLDDPVLMAELGDFKVKREVREMAPDGVMRAITSAILGVTRTILAGAGAPASTERSAWSRPVLRLPVLPAFRALAVSPALSCQLYYGRRSPGRAVLVHGA